MESNDEIWKGRLFFKSIRKKEDLEKNLEKVYVAEIEILNATDKNLQKI